MKFVCTLVSGCSAIIIKKHATHTKKKKGVPAKTLTSQSVHGDRVIILRHESIGLSLLTLQWVHKSSIVGDLYLCLPCTGVVNFLATVQYIYIYIYIIYICISVNWLRLWGTQGKNLYLFL